MGFVIYVMDWDNLSSRTVGAEVKPRFGTQLEICRVSPWQSYAHGGVKRKHEGTLKMVC
jgi:hypothetical protein